MGVPWNLDGNMFAPLVRAFLYVVAGAGIFCIGVIILLILVGVVVRIKEKIRKGV